MKILYNNALVLLFLINFVASSNATIPIRGYGSRFSANQLTINSCNGQVESPEFQRFILSNGTIFVGATNTILQLSPTFSLLHQFDNGPANDSSTCSAPLFCSQNRMRFCTGPLNCMNNYNKLMLTYRDNLLTCGTLYKSCDLLSVDDVSQRVGNKTELKCSNIVIPGKKIDISTRNKTAPFTGAAYVNNNNSDRDLLYLGNSYNSLITYYLPSENNSFFSEVDKAGSYTEDNENKVYKLIWTDAKYAYIVQARNNAGILLVKLARYCHNAITKIERVTKPNPTIVLTQDNGIAAYTEITLQCNMNGANIAKLIAAKLVFNKLYLLVETSDNATVICSSNVSAFNHEINFIRRQCWNTANGSLYARPIVQKKKPETNCRNVGSEEWATCAFHDDFKSFLSAIEGTRPFVLENQMVLHLERNETATSFAIGRANNLISVFVGTSNGRILKARLNYQESSPISEVFTTGQNSPLLDSMYVDGVGENLYSMTSNAMYKTAVSNCSQYQDCGSCLGSQDIYCGWCVLRGSCTRKEHCSGVVDSWLRPTTPSHSCPVIITVQPNTISFGSPTTLVNLSFSGIRLQANLNYSCQFLISGSTIAFHSSSLQFTNGDSRNANCNFNSPSTPPTADDHFNVTLEVIYNSKTVSTASMDLFSCPQVKELNKYTVCTSCASSEWGCSWCPSTATCEYTPTCNQAISNHLVCPVLVNVTDLAVPIPVGKSRTFVLNTEHLFQAFNGYRCSYKFCGKTIYKNAVNVNSAKAECVISESELTCDKAHSPIQIHLDRGDSYVIDVPSLSSVQGTLFNCSGGTSSCGSCVSFRSQFDQCGWCSTTSKCTLRADCSRPAISISQCSSGNISSFHPLNGPIEGGTVVNITGENLGSRISDISGVTIGNVNCVVLPEFYIPSRQILCRTSSTLTRLSGRINISTSYGTSIVSTSPFQFERVDAASFSPDVFLSRSLIAIEGVNVDVGNGVSVTVGANSTESIVCPIRTPTTITCQLGNNTEGSYSLSVSIDGYKKSFPNTLSFVPVPSLAINNSKISVFSGAGRNVSLKLSSILGLQKVVFQIARSMKSCVINQLTSSADCQVPALKQLNSNSSRKRRQAETSYDAKLIVNDVHSIEVGTVSYQPNPVLSEVSLPCRVSATSNISVQIHGKNFALDSIANSEYQVLLIPETPSVVIPCIVNFIQNTEILCRASLSAWDMYKNEKFTINVTVGSYTRQDFRQCDDNIVKIAIATAAAVIVILIFLIIGLVMWQRKKKKQQEEERKLILTKLDDLENRTRETARNAYYELQLGYMDNLAGNLTHRIIYLSPELYFTQTLFNLSRDHPTLDKNLLDNEPALRMEAIKEWTKLLNCREFLMTFIRTLEEQKGFTVQEKGNVASLLTVCLFPDMPYFTSIMFDLLTELIQKHIQKNPKLLLRRSESVVEKMVSHWLSITLYDECIMEKTGEPIFLLTKAVHYLVSSGPCDVIAHKSLNSLNESTLLGEEISFNTRTLVASIQDADTEEITGPVEVNVVDVDTISQVKEKIIEAVFKDRPYSEFPKPDQMDFELLSSDTAKEGIVLSDIDSTSSTEGGCTKINTLKHYNIPEKARAILRPVGILHPASPTTKSPLVNNKKENLYHLIHPKDEDAMGYGSVENGNGGKKTNAVLQGLINKPFQEIYLTRMVRSKTTLEEYVEKVFKSVLCPDPIPHAIRYFFHFLDREAARHRITDAEVIHIWKTNSLLLRYWVNVLKNPEFIFDINKTVIVDSCLNVITQAFMDACTTQNRKLGHDSPSNKLLYAKEAQQYKRMVKDFFVKVENTNWIDEEEMNKVLIKTSRQHSEKFNHLVASQQLYSYLFKYKDQILNSVRNEGHEDIALDIESMMAKMEDRQESVTTIV